MNNIQELEAKASVLREKYSHSSGGEWINLLVTLRALSNAYENNKKSHEALKCQEEIDRILKRKKHLSELQLPSGNHIFLTEENIGNIDYWAKKVEDYNKRLYEGESLENYLKAASALCDILSLAGQYDIAILQYEEALHTLLENDSPNKDCTGVKFMSIVLLLKASLCAAHIGDSKKAKRYSIMPLLSIAETKDKSLIIDWMDWHYIADLCKEIISST